MLIELSIDSLGVIAAAELPLGPGLTVVTGETGAGKTMVLSSLRLLSGARGQSHQVRDGHDQAFVSARFDLSDVAEQQRAAVLAQVEEIAGIADDDGTLIISRTVKATGRSRAQLAGRSVAAGVLAEFTEPLLAIHGQHDQLRLLHPDHQRTALDLFAAQGEAVAEFAALRSRWRELAEDIARRERESGHLAAEAERLQKQIDHIDAIDPQPGEDQRLKELIARIADAQALRADALSALVLVAGADAVDSGAHLGGEDVQDASTALGQALSILRSSADPELSGLAGEVSAAIAAVTDVAGSLGDYLAALPDEDTDIDALMSRQAELKELTRTIAGSIDEVLAYRQRAEATLGEVDTSDETLDRLRQHYTELTGQVAEAASALRRRRVSAAAELSTLVTAELGRLAMGQAHLSVVVEPVVAAADDPHALVVDGQLSKVTATGADQVSFMLAPYAGAQALALEHTASGGELSRLMLALEVILARSTAGTTMVFDEVDAGVGGRAAVEIGSRLAALATQHQVIVVTHLPQVAAFADTHVLLDKQIAGEVSSTVRVLDDTQRVEELARMLAGLGETQTAQAHAEELLETARSLRAAGE